MEIPLGNELFSSYLYYLVLIVVVLLFIANCYSNLSYWHKRGVPQLKGTSIFFGDFKNAILFRTAPGYHLGEIHRKSPANVPYVGFYIFHKPCLLLKDPELIKQILVRDFHVFSNRHFAGPQQKDSIGMINLFGLKNPAWQYLRNKISPTLTKSKLRQMVPLMMETGEPMMNYLKLRVVEPNGNLLDAQDVNYKYTADLIANIGLGTKTDSFGNSNSDYSKHLMSFFHSFKRMVALVTVFFMPELVEMFGSSVLFDSSFAKKIFWKAVESREESGDKRGDYIDSIIMLKNGKQNSLYEFNGDNLFSQSGVFFSGFESSSTLSAFTLMELAKNKTYQGRAREDITNAVDRYGWTVEAFDKMMYMDQCIAESARLHPPISTIDRYALRDYKIPNTNTVIEKGTPIYISLYGMHGDPDFFDEPHVFNPDRFSNDRVISDAYLPFGAGPRKCVDGDRFDFVVVGSGSAGAIVAARLSEVLGFDVLLIEAGGDPPPTSVVPGLFPTLQNTEYDWNYRAQLDKHVGQAHPDGIIPYTRGKVLGGCSSINYLIYARGVPQDYEQWNKVAPGWDWSTVLYYFKKLEGMTDTTIFENRNNAYLHSATGPVKISRPVTLATTAVLDDIRLDAFEELGIKRVLENNGPEIFGASRPHLTINNGRRSSTAEAYLKPAKDRPNLKVAKYATVTRILIDPQTLEAYGVEVSTKDGLVKIYATKEVILSAGVINSPKILLQSGIGPKRELSKLGIDNLVDLPVGKNFHDHQFIQLIVKGKFGLETAAENILVATRLDTVPAPLQCGLFRLNDSFATYPNMYQPHFQLFNIYFGAGAAPLLYVGCKSVVNFDDKFCKSFAKANALNEIDNLMLVLLHPLSRGQVSLRSKDPFDDPIINLGYFRSKYDLEVAAQGLKYLSQLTNTKFFRNIGSSIARLDIKGCEDIKWGSDEYWRCYAKNAVSTLQHGVGTCSMGRHGVVDEKLKVRSIVGLRVVDASVIPLSPSGNTNTPTMMIGEKAADMIKAEYGVFNIQPV